MQNKISPVFSRCLSRSPPCTAQASTLDSVTMAKLPQPKERDVSRGEFATTSKDTHGAHKNPLEATSTTWWPSTTTSSSTSRLPSALPLQEIHIRGYNNSSATDSTRTEPPMLGRRQCINLPSQCDGQSVVLHSSLLCPEGAGISWDLGEPEERIENMNERWCLSKELANHPPLPSMTVVHPQLPWPITVHASGTDSRGVTVADVLLAISRNLMIPTDEAGERRLSYLGGRHMFVGLQVSEIGGDVWELVVR
ncbi:hypothetical protein L218DRAFT_1080994 [Marasmius fiardii PR-910]|nr:hypothetical protein L218DRAFT_1080994 [Marasmius fiardii PR-910]